MARLTQGVPAQVFTPKVQKVIELSGGSQTVPVYPDGMVRYTCANAIRVSLGDTFDANACFEASDNVFGIKAGIDTITLNGTGTVYLEIG